MIKYGFHLLSSLRALAKQSIFRNGLPRRPEGLLAMTKDSGVAAVEFALVVPVLITLLLAGYQMNTYFLVHQKVEKIAYTVADVTAQSDTITAPQLDLILDSAAQIMDPYPFLEDGIVIVSSIYKETDTSDPVVRWQYVGGGTLPRVSLIGAANEVAALPGGLVLNARENIIVAEVFYDNQLSMEAVLSDQEDIYKYAIYKPRLGDLLTAPGAS